MAESYGWAGKVLRVDLTSGTITKITGTEFEKYKAFMGGTGLGWKVLWDEVPPGTGAFDAANKVIFAVGPATGSGSPSSGRTSICTLWPVHADELPSAGHMGGHWGPELKYAGYDAVIVEGVSAKPVWLRIEDDKVTLEDASAIWGQGIYRATNYICNLMGTEAHVAAIGQAGENKLRLGAVFCDRSHRAGGAGGVLGSKMLKAIGVRGTGAVRIALDKKAWRDLNNYYLGIIGCNNQGVVAQNLQPWSEYSPGGTRWTAAPGVYWGSALPPVHMGNCPDVEHPMVDAPYPANKIGMRTQKGYLDFGAEGMKRTVRMDGCHACPIRCHIAADHPELENYGISRYNMNTCIGNGGVRNTIVNTGGSNPQQNVMLCTYMSNHLEGDYGIWCDYSGWTAVWSFLWDEKITNTDDVIPATIKDAAGLDIPNPLIGQPLLAKYLSAAEWTRIRTTALWSSGKSPLALSEAGDPRWVQFFAADIAANVPGTVGWFYGRGPAWTVKEGAGLRANGKSWADAMTFTPTGGTAQVIRPELPPDYGIPELEEALYRDSHVHMWKQAHTLHHSIECGSQVGGIMSTMQACRDMNNHTPQNFNTNGLPNSAALPLKVAIAQEIALSSKTYFKVGTADRPVAAGEWAWPTAGVWSPSNWARAGFAVQALVSYDLHNSLTQCNYTLPVWASPRKTRLLPYTESDGTTSRMGDSASVTSVNGIATTGYRGDPELDVKVYNAVTGENLTQAEYEKIGLRLYTMWRVYTARILSARNAGTGANMRTNFDQAPAWAFEDQSTDPSLNNSLSTVYALRPRTHLGVPVATDPNDWELMKDMVYDLLGYDKTTGLPTAATLTDVGLGDTVATLQAEGIIP